MFFNEGYFIFLYYNFAIALLINDCLGIWRGTVMFESWNKLQIVTDQRVFVVHLKWYKCLVYMMHSVEVSWFLPSLRFYVKIISGFWECKICYKTCLDVLNFGLYAILHFFKAEIDQITKIHSPSTSNCKKWQFWNL